MVLPPSNEHVGAASSDRDSPTRTALIFALEPVFAWATSFLLIGEKLSPKGMAGGVLILSGVVLAELKPGWGRRHPLR